MQKQFDGEGQTAQHDTAGTSGYLQAKSKEVTERERGREERREGEGEEGRKDFNPSLRSYTKINSKHIMDWKVKHKTIKLFENWASLVAQWLRICLLMQGTRVRALVWEDPTCRGAARPVSHSY